MIPRLRPFLGTSDFAALLPRWGNANAEPAFERAFADAFALPHALSFAYGRTALLAVLEAEGVRGAEVILPAYTCSVVGHAVVESGNRPVFVDCAPDSVNMDLDRLAEALSERTGAVVATHLFGFALDLDRVAAMMANAAARHGRRILVIQDCAHAFGAAHGGRQAAQAGDCAIFGLGISKIVTTIFGGVLATADGALAARVEAWRARRCVAPPASKPLIQSAYLLAAALALQDGPFTVVDWLERHTGLLDRLNFSDQKDEPIHLPPDHLNRLTGVAARVGLAQLARYDDNLRRRRETATFYLERLAGLPGLVLPPDDPGATWPHFPVLVDDRPRWLGGMRRRGVQLGTVIDYVVPDLAPYRQWADRPFPHARRLQHAMINLPIHPDLTPDQRRRVADAAVATARKDTLP